MAGLAFPFTLSFRRQGENLQKWMGAPGAPQFASLLEPYARGGATAPVSGGTCSATNCNPPEFWRQTVRNTALNKVMLFRRRKKANFMSSGNMRFVANASAAGHFYTVLTLDRTGEIDALKQRARHVGGTLVVERYLSGNDLIFQCSAIWHRTARLSAQSLAGEHTQITFAPVVNFIYQRGDSPRCHLATDIDVGRGSSFTIPTNTFFRFCSARAGTRCPS
jgi:hypothetical protein